MTDAPRLLAVAGHDPTGGAGVDADLATARAFGVEAEAVVTAHTDQDGRRVHAVVPRPVEAWLAEARASVERAAPTVLKSGLLPGADAVRALARLAAECAGPLVVDPVLAASGGEEFLDAAGVATLLEELLPVGPLLTPNLPEAARLTGRSLEELVRSPAERVAAATELLGLGARAVVLKGGHADEDPARDLLLSAGEPPRWLEHRRVPGGGLHGSGCRHAAALAAGLALGRPLERAAREAGEHVRRLIAGDAGR